MPKLFLHNGTILRIWDIYGDVSLARTNYLQNYWSNSLLLVKESGHPMLIWGPYKKSGSNVVEYQLYRKFANSSSTPDVSTFSYLTTTGYNVYNYMHNIDTGSGLNSNFYYVKAKLNSLNEPGGSAFFSLPSNVVKVGLPDPVKLAAESEVPLQYSLKQNYPNPFNPSTIISFSIPNDDKVVIAVYDILGREVSLLLNEYMEAGKYDITFNGSGLSSGIYFYRLTAGKYSEVKKFQLLK